MTASALEASGLRHSYRNSLQLVVDEISLSKGEVLCLLGPSGAGKSTLLRILGLLERPDAGVVKIDGMPATPRDLSSRRGIATAMQSATLWRGTVIENAEFGLRVRGIPRRERRPRAMKFLAAMGVEDLAARPATEISGGQAQRVALARALAVHPAILLLDEPLAHVDEPLRESLAFKLRRVVKDEGCAALWVTHHREEAIAIGDRIAVMSAGRLLQTGDPIDVFARPANEEVARTVGAENVLAGRVISTEEGLARIEVSGIQIEAMSPVPHGGEVLLLVRPENVLVWTTPPAGSSPRNRFRAVLREAVTLGPLAKIYVDGPVPLVALLTRPTYEEMGVAPGSEIWVGFKTTSAHVIRRS